MPFTKDVGVLMYFGELGVLLLLSAIGLKIKPKKLCEMRNDIYGVRPTKVLLCGGILTIPPFLLCI